MRSSRFTLSALGAIKLGKIVVTFGPVGICGQYSHLLGDVLLCVRIEHVTYNPVEVTFRHN